MRQIAQLPYCRDFSLLLLQKISGAFSTPLATIYGATKSFVDKFSRDLSAECRAQGITVQTVHPGKKVFILLSNLYKLSILNVGFVKTNMSKLKKSSFTVPDANTFAKAALSTLGAFICPSNLI